MTFVALAVQRIACTGGVADDPARFQVELSATVLSDDDHADVVSFTVQLPFDAAATYAAIEAQAISRARLLAGSIRDAEQTHSPPPTEQSDS